MSTPASFAADFSAVVVGHVGLGQLVQVRRLLPIVRIGQPGIAEDLEEEPGGILAVAAMHGADGAQRRHHGGVGLVAGGGGELGALG